MYQYSKVNKQVWPILLSKSLYAAVIIFFLDVLLYLLIFILLEIYGQFALKRQSDNMNNKANKWKRSIQLLEKKSRNSKSKWQQYSEDKHSVIHDFRTMPFPDLLKKYPNFSDFFWRDKGKASKWKIWNLISILLWEMFS